MTEPAASTAGPVLFARYAYPPNALGYCGPSDSRSLLEAAADGALAELRHRASGFEGAWPYLELIAGCNGIRDPLDPRVVEAYWIGNELLYRVPVSALGRSLRERFEHRAGRRLDSVVGPASTGLAQHSFHVFAVYPWLGLLRAGKATPALDVLDRCRIRWGRVVSVEGDFVSVRSRSLRFESSRLTLGSERLETARRASSSICFVDELQPGTIVSLHWDWVCDRLSTTGARWLIACTRRNLRAVNSLPGPGPAVAFGGA